MTFTWGDLTITSIVSLLLGALSGHFLAKDRSRVERSVGRYNSAVAELRKAFSEELAFLRSLTLSEWGKTYQVLKTAFPKHEKAVFEFRDNLKGRQREAFESAWRSYYFPLGINLILPEVETPTYILGQYIGCSSEEEVEVKRKAIAAIETLLSHAKER